VQSAQGHLVFKVRNVEADDKPDNEKTITIPTDDLKKPLTLVGLGIDSAEMYILKVKPDSPASRAGIMAKDRIVAIDGKPTQSWNDVLEKVKGYHDDGPPIHVTIAKYIAGSSDMGPRIANQDLEIRPELTDLMNAKGQSERRYTIGVVSGSFKVGSELTTIKIKDPIQLTYHGVQQSVEWTGIMVMSIVRLVQGEVSAKNIGGIITIGRVASRSFEIGISSFLKTMAILSINLFLLNLLPIPVLDGGHLVFFSLEAIKGSPVSLKKLAIAQQVGLTLLIMLMVFALFNDFTNLLTTRW